MIPNQVWVDELNRKSVETVCPMMAQRDTYVSFVPVPSCGLSHSQTYTWLPLRLPVTHGDKIETWSDIHQTDSIASQKTSLCVCGSVPVWLAGWPSVLGGNPRRRAAFIRPHHPTTSSQPVRGRYTTSRTNTITAPPNQRTTRVVKRLWEGANGWNNNRNGRGFDSPPAKQNL